MVYAPAISPNDIDAEVFRRGSDLLVVVNVGYDDEKGAIYSLVLGLSPMAGGGALELFFHIVEAFEDGRREEIYWSGKDTHFISKPDRVEILMILVALTAKLLETETPEAVMMITHDGDMPSKAMKKHTLIARVFKEHGYQVRRFDGYHGKVTWKMTLEPKPSI